MEDPRIDTDLIDETVVGLMHLNLHGDKWETRAWKSFPWESLSRLYAKGLIRDPVGKAKSVGLTDEGLKRCEEAFNRLFVRKSVDQAPSDS